MAEDWQNQLEALLLKYTESDLNESEQTLFLDLIHAHGEDPIFRNHIQEVMWSHFLLWHSYHNDQENFRSEMESDIESTWKENDFFDRMLLLSENSPSLTVPIAQPETPKTLPNINHPPIKTYDAQLNQPGKSSIVLLIGLIFLGCWAIYIDFIQPNSASAFVPVATVSDIAAVAVPENEHNADIPLLRKGQSLLAEQILVPAGGAVELNLSNGVRVAIEGPAKYHIQSEMQTFCEQGRISVEVPDKAKGFEVRTPFMDVRDLGTEFLVDVTEETSEVHVIKGIVETGRVSKGWSTLFEGRGLRFFSNETSRQIPAEPARYMSRQNMVKKAEDFDQLQREARETIAQKDRSDPALAFHLNPVNDWKIGRGVITGPGRYRKTKSVEFRRTTDFVPIQTQATTKQLTLCTSICLNNLDRSCNAILATKGFTDSPGFCWTVDGTGRIQFQLMEEGKQVARIYETQACITPKLHGAWLDLALTIDTTTGKLVHYLNGSPVATCNIPNETVIPMGELTLGNWLRSGRNPKGRHIQGQIDALSIFVRSLSPEEIKERTFP